MFPVVVVSFATVNINVSLGPAQSQAADHHQPVSPRIIAFDPVRPIQDSHQPGQEPIAPSTECQPQ